MLRFFSERRLCPLTIIPYGEAEMAQLAELLAAAKDGTSSAEDTLSQLASDSEQTGVLASSESSR